MTAFIWGPPPKRPSPWIWVLIITATIIGALAAG